MQTHILKIRDISECTSWLFCPRVQNSAGILTTGSHLKNDGIKKFWLGGTPFLQLPHEDWPSTKYFENYKSNESHYLAGLSNSFGKV